MVQGFQKLVKKWLHILVYMQHEKNTLVNGNFYIELFKVSESSTMQLSNQSDTSEVLYYLFLQIKTGVPL